MRLVLALGAVLMLGGCSGGLAELKRLNPQASDFDSSLSAEYLAYADSEAELGHPVVAHHFANKGLAAYRHETVLPDMPEETNAPQLASRKQLMAALTEDVKHVAPQKAARAQLLYDCWLTQGKDASRNGLTPCSGEFHSSMAELQAVVDSFVFGEDLSHRILFAENSAALSHKAHAEMYAISEHIKNMVNFEIVLADHTNDAAQAALTEKRLRAIRQAFIRAGVKPAQIIHNSADDTKEVLISTGEMEHNAVDVTVRTSGGRQ